MAPKTPILRLIMNNYVKFEFCNISKLHAFSNARNLLFDMLTKPAPEAYFVKSGMLGSPEFGYRPTHSSHQEGYLGEFGPPPGGSKRSSKAPSASSPQAPIAIPRRGLRLQRNVTVSHGHELNSTQALPDQEPDQLVHIFHIVSENRQLTCEREIRAFGKIAQF